MATGKTQKKIVMFPFMAYGHLNPFMALARQLERRKAYTVTIINTPLNIQKLKSSLPPNNTNITLVEIPFNVEPIHGLPPNVENTDALSYQEIVLFILASADLQAPFRNLLVHMTEKDGCPPLCIISDIFLGWTVEVANELGIFHSVFIAGAGYSMAAYFSISLNMHSYEAADEDELFLPDFPEASQIQSSQLGYDLKYTDAIKAWWAFRERQFSLCFRSDAVLLNTIKGLGEIGVKYFSRKLGAGKSVWMIGPACSNVNKDHDLHSNDISSWLDVHPPGSVLYASFGSQNALLPSQMRELALGLEASGKPFIWVIRPPIGFCATKEPKGEWFPDGFEERVRKKNQGILIFKWAPQMEILSHKSTGAFLSHCGWNSVLESLCQGVPIIGWPLVAEQLFNSKMLEEAGVCIEMARGTDSEDVKRDRIAEVIKMVLGKVNKGEEISRKAGEVKVKLEEAIKEGEGFKGSSVKAMDEFLNAASLIKTKGMSPMFK